MEALNQNPSASQLSFDSFKAEILKDFRVAVESREASLLGRREVLGGKAKFGIFGDGKEIAQVAWAKFFKPGDFRSGYYRDQTFMLAAGLLTVEEFFAQLYADPDEVREPMSAGRQMNGHFATPFVNEKGEWLNLSELKNVSADISPTAGQMPRGLGLAFASSCFRKNEALHSLNWLSSQGNEVCFTTIGDASTSEGHFWETINAAGVLQVPLVVFVWDDGYGISVPKKYQTTKSSISDVLSGFEHNGISNGLDIYKVKGWDYAALCETIEQATTKTRDTHIPCLIHVEEITQPQGHSTSGSHERYKKSERLEWEKNWDGIKKMREWVLTNALADEAELDAIETEAKEHVKESKARAWEKFITPIRAQVTETAALTEQAAAALPGQSESLLKLAAALKAIREPLRRDVMKTLFDAIDTCAANAAAQPLKNYYEQLRTENKAAYNSLLYNEGPRSAMNVPAVAAEFATDAPTVNGYEVLNKFFDQLFTADPRVFAFGEDVGKIGDVNQGFSGLQEKFGKHRIFDTGIRELTIIGQGIGLAMRGLRPITEIQYLDYLLYALQPLSDDVSTLHYRTKGKQSCPLIVRTRGHRLEGVWHSGSPMGMIINALRGMYICVPRNMVQAVGMYNTLLQSNDPGLIIECLNGYRLKEQLPANLLNMTVPFGIPETLREGSDITLVSYGSTLRIVSEAANRLAESGIECTVIDVQTLLPFDIHHHILQSLKHTGRILFIDEDVPGGATAYMFNKVMEEQGGYRWLDAAPRTLSAQAHRPAYGSDGDYFSKPGVEDVILAVKEMMAE